MKHLISSLIERVKKKVSHYAGRFLSDEKDIEWVERNLTSTDEEVKQHALKIYPQDKFSALYKPVNYDMQSAMFADGYLVTGEPKTALKKTLFTTKLYKSAVIKMNTLRRKAALYSVMFSAFVAYLVSSLAVKSSFLITVESKGINQELMAWGMPIIDTVTTTAPDLFAIVAIPLLFVVTFLAALNVTVKAVEKNYWKVSSGIGLAVSNPVSTILFAFFVYFLIESAESIYSVYFAISGLLIIFAIEFFAPGFFRGAKSVNSLANGAIEAQTAWLNIPTKDAYTRFIQRKKERDLERFSYTKQVDHQAHIANKTRVLIGYSTGLLRAKGSLNSKESGMPIVMNGDDLAQNILILGGTGAGKSVIALLNFIRQLLGIKNTIENSHKDFYENVGQFKYGAFIMDAKGTFYQPVLEIAKKLGRQDDVVLIGTNSNNKESGLVAKNINILSGLSPVELSNIIMSTSSVEGDGLTWVKKAGKLITNVAFIAKALNNEEIAKIGDTKPYSLNWIYQVSSSDELVNKYTQLLESFIEKGRFTKDNTKDFLTVIEALNYFKNNWSSLAVDTKSSIISNVSDLIGDLPLSEELNSLYGKGVEDENTIDIDDIFSGRKIFVFNLTTAKDGEIASLIMKMIKAQFYRSALVRLENEGALHCANNPVFTMYDEAQEILTAGSGGVTDTEFWNKARETGVHAIIATQAISSLTQALGNENTENFIGQMRTKIIMNNEDIQTNERVEKWLGQAQRAKVFDNQVVNGERRAYESIDEMNDVLGLRLPNLQVIESITDNASNHLDFSTREFNRVEKELAVESSGIFGSSDKTDYQKQISDLIKRKKDKDTDFLKDGNERENLFNSADVPTLSNWQAICFIKQSGHVTKDVIRLKPSYEDFNWTETD